MNKFQRSQKGGIGSTERGLELLPATFQPGEWDVICQRGKESYVHIGNQNFRIIIQRNVERYDRVKSRQEKSIIVSEIVSAVRRAAAAASSEGGFVRKDLLTRRWYRVDDKVAREKCGQALRDIIKANKRRDGTSDDGGSNGGNNDESNVARKKRKRLNPSLSSQSLDAAGRAFHSNEPVLQQKTGISTIGQGSLPLFDTMQEAQQQHEVQPMMLSGTLKDRRSLSESSIFPMSSDRTNAALFSSSSATALTSMYSIEELEPRPFDDQRAMIPSITDSVLTPPVISQMVSSVGVQQTSSTFSHDSAIHLASLSSLYPTNAEQQEHQQDAPYPSIQQPRLQHYEQRVLPTTINSDNFTQMGRDVVGGASSSPLGDEILLHGDNHEGVSKLGVLRHNQSHHELLNKASLPSAAGDGFVHSKKDKDSAIDAAEYSPESHSSGSISRSIFED